MRYGAFVVPGLANDHDLDEGLEDLGFCGD